MKANYHTHVKLCGHAVGMSEDYVKEAIKLGYESLGMSDHGPIERYMMTKEEFSYNWLDRQMTYEIFKNTYLPDVLKTKIKYKDQIKVYAGLEIEYIAKYHDYFVKLRADLDYLNLALHFFYHNNEIINGFHGVNYKNVIGYAEYAKKAMETGLYSIFVHPDVFMHQYVSVNGKNEFDEECRKASIIIIEAAIASGVYLELNCGGVRKVINANEVVGNYGYPAREFWEIAKGYKDLKIIIGADAHKPNELGDEAVKLAKKFASELQLNIETFCLNIEKKD